MYLQGFSRPNGTEHEKQARDVASELKPHRERVKAYENSRWCFIGASDPLVTVKG